MVNVMDDQDDALCMKEIYPNHMLRDERAGSGSTTKIATEKCDPYITQ